MWCICIDKETAELFTMERSEREAMLSVLLDLKQPIPSYVINFKSTKEEAEKYIEEIKRIDKDINNLLNLFFYGSAST
jgi:hypothetical protein